MKKRPSLASSMRIAREDTTPNPDALVAAASAEANHESASSDEPVKPAKQDKPANKAKSDKRYAGMKLVLIPLDEATHRRVKIRALEEGKTLEKACQDLLAAYAAR